MYGGLVKVGTRCIPVLNVLTTMVKIKTINKDVKNKL